MFGNGDKVRAIQGAPFTLAIRYHYVRDQVESGDCVFYYTPTADQAADELTKLDLRLRSPSTPVRNALRKDTESRKLEIRRLNKDVIHTVSAAALPTSIARTLPYDDPRPSKRLRRIVEDLPQCNDLHEATHLLPGMLRILPLFDLIAANDLSRTAAASTFSAIELQELDRLLQERRARSRVARMLDQATDDDCAHLEDLVLYTRTAEQITSAIESLPQGQARDAMENFRQGMDFSADDLLYQINLDLRGIQQFTTQSYNSGSMPAGDNLSSIGSGKFGRRDQGVLPICPGVENLQGARGTDP